MHEWVADVPVAGCTISRVMELVNAEPSQANLGESANEAQYFWVCMISPRMFSAKTNSM